MDAIQGALFLGLAPTFHWGTYSTCANVGSMLTGLAGFARFQALRNNERWVAAGFDIVRMVHFEINPSNG